MRWPGLPATSLRLGVAVICFTSNFWSLTIDGLNNGFLYALIALGYTLVYGVLQLINFAHSEVFMAGGFGGLLLTQWLVGTGNPSGWSAVAYVAAGMAMGAVAGGMIAFLLERVAYRPLRRRHAPRLAFLITAIGASYFLFSMAGHLFGRDAQSVPTLFNNKRVFSIFSADVHVFDLLVAGSALAMLVLLDRMVARTRLGQGIRAVAQDAETASLLGVNIDRVISQTFIIGGLLGGVAGFLFGMGSSVGYTMGFVPGLKAFTAAVLGGIGNLRGAMLGGIALGLVENWGVTCVRNSWRDVIAFGILVLVLMFRPTGLLGERLGRSA
ncbi:MAG: branched-chain amino acid transport system permease protein [Mycobacterium sp.]|nr:branched-chain amino acid transport system permease protein [Mycobacterium sp.]